MISRMYYEKDSLTKKEIGKTSARTSTTEFAVPSSWIVPDSCKSLPGNLLGLRRGTNLAPIANAIEGPNRKPLASTPAKTS